MKPEIIWHKKQHLIEIHTQTGSIIFNDTYAGDIAIELSFIDIDKEVPNDSQSTG